MEKIDRGKNIIKGAVAGLMCEAQVKGERPKFAVGNLVAD
jgi:hypothetical protein